MTEPERRLERSYLRRQPSAATASVRRDRYASRSVLVRKLAQEFTRDRAPRLELMIVLVLAGAAAFLASVWMLWWGGPAFERMALRYGAAALTGYIAFIGLIRLWIALHRPSRGPGLDPDITADVIESAVTAPGSTPPCGEEAVDIEVDLPLELEPGGISDTGTSGAARWSVLDTRGAGGGLDLDLDDLVWLLIAAVCTIAGAMAIAYVIYIAPVLLAEVALDAAIISALYRRLRADETGHWLTTVLTRTWVPALIVVAFAMIAGYALQVMAPEAKTIGGVIRAVSG